MMYNKSLFGVSCLIAFGLLISSCAGLPPPQDAAQRTGQPTRTDREPSRQPQQQDLSLPVRFQQPSYVTKDYTLEQGGGLAPSDLSMKVGADIKTMSGPVTLREIMKRLASLKDMSLSWDSDVNQDALVDVHLRAEDDYFQAINNLLWQLDYYHEVRKNTILIKYMKSQTFHLAMPFMVNNFNVAVGGDVLGSSGGQSGGQGGGGGNNVKGNVQLNSEISKVPAESVAIDVWRNIQTNLDKILEFGTVTPAMLEKTETAEATGTAPQAPPPSPSSAAPRKGYYTIDKPVGLITVTAPPFLLEKIAQYLEHLKKELYRQVSIEAKIVEVNLTNGSKKGIDWSKLLDSLPITAHVEFGTGGQVYPSEGSRFISKISLDTTSFDILIQALEEQGETRVLSNPRLSVMNGQPALISIGENVAYIDKVTSTQDLGVITYSVSTSSVMSGLAMAVVPNIMEGGEIVMQLTPVTSQLDGEIKYKAFGGAAGTEVGLPTVKLRELNTTVRVKDGEMLVVGGLIDNNDEITQKKVPILGDLPLVGVIFKSDVKQKTQRELIILLQSKIIS